MAKYATVDGSGVLTAFYDSVISPPPAGAVELTDAQYATWLQQQHLLIWSNGALASAPVVVVPVPEPTFAEQLGALLAAGCAIVSTSTPALNGIYACDAESRSDIMAETVSLLLNGTFTNGDTTLEYSDSSQTMHAFTVDAFKAFAPAIGAYVGALKALGVKGSGAFPPQPVTIA